MADPATRRRYAILTDCPLIEGPARVLAAIARSLVDPDHLIGAHQPVGPGTHTLAGLTATTLSRHGGPPVSALMPHSCLPSVDDL